MSRAHYLDMSTLAAMYDQLMPKKTSRVLHLPLQATCSRLFMAPTKHIRLQMPRRIEAVCFHTIRVLAIDEQEVEKTPTGLRLRE